MNVSVSGVGIDRPQPAISIFPSKTQICKNDIVRLSSTLQNFQNERAYKWFKNDTLIAVTDSSFFDISTLRNLDVIKVENTSYTTCPISVTDQTIPFSVFSFQLNAGRDTTIYQGEKIQLNASSDGTIFNWKPNLYLSNNNTLQPFATPQETITYWIESQKNGCTLSDQMTVHVYQKNLVPTNCFSPNGDNINDTWEIPFLDDFPSCDIKIFTRWGQTVYETTGYNYKKAWDGTHNGSVVDEGVYFFVIQLRDAHYAEPLKGTITIIK
jgi:gliding motility-associated-like protein